MKACWRTDPECRPAFSNVVDRLVAMEDVELVHQDCDGEATTDV